MMINYRILRSGLLILTLSFLGGCKKNKQSFFEDIIEERQMVLHVEGIECDDCASLAVKKLEEIEGVRSVVFVKGEDNSFEQGSLVVTHSPLVSLVDMSAALKREGFEIA